MITDNERMFFPSRKFTANAPAALPRYSETIFPDSLKSYLLEVSLIL